MITSRSNGQVKKIKELIRSPKARAQEGLFVVEGSRIVSEVPAELLAGVYASESYEAPEGAEIISDDVFKSISDTVNPQGILALVRQPERSFEDMKKLSLYVLLDDVRDPGNLGTIIRTAEAAGAGVIMSPECADIFNPKVTRSTMGSIFRVPWAVMPLEEAIKSLRKEGVLVAAAALDGAVDYKEITAPRRAYIIGNEARGVSPEIQALSDARVKIPMKGQVESLNAAISAAILMYS